MRLEELKSLTDDELAMLSYAINKINPPVLAGVELEPSVFCAIKASAIRQRIDQLEPAIKDEHKSIYDSLRHKLNMPPIIVNSPVSGSISGSGSASV